MALLTIQGTKLTNLITIQIINYPGAMQSAVHGLSEMFSLANSIAKDFDEEIEFKKESEFKVEVVDCNLIEQSTSALSHIVILPPNLSGDYYLNSSESVREYLRHKRRSGSIICSACAGAFILADSGLLDNRPVTTHWQLADKFKSIHPAAHLSEDKVLINDTDIISAGGLMSWVDLGLELVAQFSRPIIMRKLGKLLVIDTGRREQRYYQSFNPKLDHGDETILNIQQFLHRQFQDPISINSLCEKFHITERTLIRRFIKATAVKPMKYLQRVRVQKACELLESTNKTTEQIASKIGYNDTNAFRRVFHNIMGLNPSEFKARFSSL